MTSWHRARFPHLSSINARLQWSFSDHPSMHRRWRELWLLWPCWLTGGTVARTTDDDINAFKCFNSLMPRLNGRDLEDAISKSIFLNENCKGVHVVNDVIKYVALTHWGRVTHICVSKQTIIGSDNGLSPGRRQAIIWTNAGILLIGTLGTNFSEILIEIRIFSFKKMGLKVSSAKWRPFCLGLNVLTSFV